MFANRIVQMKTFFINIPNKLLKKCDKSGYFYQNE